MNTRTFPRSWLEQRYIALDIENSRVVHREEVSRQEGGAVYAVVIEDDEKFWRMTYRENALGEFKVDPWFDQEEVLATEVVPMPKLSITWAPIADDVIPRPACRRLTAYGERNDCQALADWAVSCVANGSPLEIHACQAHLHDMFRIRKDLVQIHEVKRW